MSWSSQIWQLLQIRLLFSRASTGSGLTIQLASRERGGQNIQRKFIQTALAKWKPVEVLVFEQTGAAAQSEWGISRAKAYYP